MALDAPLTWSRSEPESAPLDTPAPPPLAAAPVLAAKRKFAVLAPSTSIDRIIDSVADELQLDRQLLHAMIYVESRYNTDALSIKGAVGLMQVLPGTGARFGYTDLRHPHTNVRAGATYLKWLLNRFDNNLELAIAGYNAGEGAVEKYGRTIPPYRETQNYVHQVIKRYRNSSTNFVALQARQQNWRRPETKNAVTLQNTAVPLSKLIDLLLSSPVATQEQGIIQQ